MNVQLVVGHVFVNFVSTVLRYSGLAFQLQCRQVARRAGGFTNAPLSKQRCYSFSSFNSKTAKSVVFPTSGKRVVHWCKEVLNFMLYCSIRHVCSEMPGSKDVKILSRSKCFDVFPKARVCIPADL